MTVVLKSRANGSELSEYTHQAVIFPDSSIHKPLVNTSAPADWHKFQRSLSILYKFSYLMIFFVDSVKSEATTIVIPTDNKKKTAGDRCISDLESIIIGMRINI